MSLPTVGQVRLLDHLGRLQEERRRNREAHGLRRLEVDDEVELHGLLDGQLSRPRTLENFVHEAGRAPEEVGDVRPIGHEATRVHEFPAIKDRRHPLGHGKSDDLVRVHIQQGLRQRDQRISTRRDGYILR